MQLRLTRTYPDHPHERYGETQWRVMMDGYAYSVGSVRESAEGWMPYNIGRNDWGMGHIESPSFPTREAACAYIRSTLEAGEAAASKAVSDALGLLAPFMSPVECIDKRYEDVDIVVGLINPTTRLSVTTTMTPAETLSALDSLWDLSGGTMQVTVVGWLQGEKMRAYWRRDFHHHGYAAWSIPSGSNDYHVAGWRSRSGKGRRWGE